MPTSPAWTPEELGPVVVHEASGAIDVLVEDEAEAIAVARKYLMRMEFVA